MNFKAYLLFFVFFTFFIIQYLFPKSNVQIQNEIKKEIQTLIVNGSVLLHDPQGKKLLSIQEKKQFIPASIIKILTSLIALETLGNHYHFETEFYTNSNNELLIFGKGDPFLISEEIQEIAKQLLKKGFHSFRSIYLDSSWFQQIKVEGVFHSLNPYDALNTSLAVNFNTLYLKKDKKGRLFSAESVTPLTPLALKKSYLIPLGKKERINLGNRVEDVFQYVGELFFAIFKSENITIQNNRFLFSKKNSLSKKWKKIYSHKNSRKLSFILQQMMKYSNNYIANQIFITLGIHQKTPPANLQKAQQVVHKYLKSKFNLTEKEIYIEEGSGISRNNQISASSMMKILQASKHITHLFSEENNIKIKTGTLTGVYNLAGFITKKKALYPYVILLNQTQNKRKEILNQLQKYVACQP